jgi:photosystem II stability/assembly factor-like uncharacterized protein
MKKKILLATALLFSSLAFAQLGADAPWMQSFTDNPRQAKFQDIQNAFEAYWADKDETKKGSGYKPFKRWESLQQDFLNPDGTVISGQQHVDAWRQKNANRNSQVDNGDWESVGPYSHLETGSWSPGQGRVNSMAVDPNNSSTYFVGTPAGGFWKSTDAGTNWEILTDNLPQLGVSAIAIDPANSNIMYLGTGDDDAGDSNGIGVLKTIDGGVTWNFTGLNETNSPSAFSEIFIHPTDSDVLWTSSASGLFKTTDAGNTWTRTRTGNIRDLRLKPGNPDVLYIASSTTIFKSTDAGETWQAKTTGTPTGTSRLAIDVTPANPEIVYIFAADKNNNFKGIYKSEDAGESFILTSPGAPDVFDGASQSWYDFAFAVSDIDENEIYTGVLNVWRSIDSGASFSRLNNWSSPNQPSYTHADIHNLRFLDGKLFCGSDGGIYVSEDRGVNFADLTEGLAIGQFYRIAVAPQNSSLMAGGLQDNGGYARTNDTWHCYYGADGMEIAIDPNDPNNIYGLIQSGGGPYVSNNGGASLTTSNFPSAPDSGNWITPFEFTADGRLLGAYTSLYEFNTTAATWTIVSNPLGDRVDYLAPDPNEESRIYIAINRQLRMSTDGGSTFSTLATLSSDISWIDVDSDEDDLIYVTTRGSGGSVYRGVISGSTIDLEDITGSLPNIPKIVVKHQPEHTDNPLYLGTTLGVWRYDDAVNDWAPFDENLPSVIVRDLDINIEDSNITAATYGRGIWQSAIASEPLSVDSFDVTTFKVGPNPSNGRFELQWANSTNTSFTVYDITGKQVLTIATLPSGTKTHRLDMSSYATGMYILQASMDGRTVAKKLIIK